MIRWSQVHCPAPVEHGEVFSARQFSRHALEQLCDPVLQVDWFNMAGPTFPPHPHAGFSAVTYLFADSPNGFINRDSLGNTCQILPGAVHWSRASRGIVHEEFPIPDGGPALGLQIFVNLPAKYQLDPPAAFAVPAEEIERVKGEGWISRLAICGQTLAGDPDALPAPVLIEETRIDDGHSRELNLPAGWGGLLIVIEGSVSINNGTTVSTHESIAMATDEDSEVTLSALGNSARFVVIAGERTNQPAFQHGPLTMASQELLQDRIESLNRGEFGEIAT